MYHCVMDGVITSELLIVKIRMDLHCKYNGSLDYIVVLIPQYFRNLDVKPLNFVVV